MAKALVGIVLGSATDLEVMKEAGEFLKKMGISFEITIASAHRAPKLAAEFGETAESRGLKVIIAGASGAAHLPGVIASFTTLPVIGVPLKSVISIDGWDSLLSIVQMPSGVPVATVGLNAAKNAGVLAAQIIGTSDKAVHNKLIAYKKELEKKVKESAAKLR